MKNTRSCIGFMRNDDQFCVMTRNGASNLDDQKEMLAYG